MVFKLMLDFICGINKITNHFYTYLPLIYSVITIIFIILGIAGVIAFAFGFKFKNFARDFYGFIHLMTTFICMLIIFNLTYCSVIFPTNTKSKDKGEVPPENSNSFISKSIKPIKDNILKVISKVLYFINNLLDNISVPLIVVQVLCTTIIVLITTILSAIFSGISKACYQMHCSDSNQVFYIPWWGKLVDFFMHLLLFISSIFVVFYFIFKTIKAGVKAITSGFGLKPSDPNIKPESINNQLNNIHPKVNEAFTKLNYAMNEWPMIRAVFVISLSYYIIQLILRWFEDIISNNIVVLTNWQKGPTGCGDEANNETIMKVERIVILVCNILLFILILVITLVLLFINTWFCAIVINFLKIGPKIYIPASAALSAPVSLESIKKTIHKVSNGKINVENMEHKAFEVLSKVEKNVDNVEDKAYKLLSNVENITNKIDIDKITSMLNEKTNAKQVATIKSSPEKPPSENGREARERINNRISYKSIPPPQPPPPQPQPPHQPQPPPPQPQPPHQPQPPPPPPPPLPQPPPPPPPPHQPQPPPPPPPPPLPQPQPQPPPP